MSTDTKEIEKKPQQTQGNADSLLENPEAIQEQISKTEQLIKNNFKLIIGVAVAIVGVIAFFMYNNKSSSETELEAANEIFRAEYHFRADSLEWALNGDGNQGMGLLEVASKYEGTKAANRANFLIGSTYLKQQKFQDAISYLQKFKSDDLFVQARAYCLTGDAYMEMEDYANAISAYTKASEYKPNDQFTPAYLMKLALAYEMNSQMANAVQAYEQIVGNHPGASNMNEAKKYLARAKAINASASTAK